MVGEMGFHMIDATKSIEARQKEMWKIVALGPAFVSVCKRVPTWDCLP